MRKKKSPASGWIRIHDLQIDRASATLTAGLQKLLTFDAVLAARGAIAVIGIIEHPKPTLNMFWQL